MKPDRLALLMALLPLLGTAVPLLEYAFAPSRKSAGLPSRLAAVLGLVGPLVVLALLYPYIANGGVIRFNIGDWSPIVAIQYRLDGPAWFACVLVAVVSICSGVYALVRREYSAIYWFLFLLCVYSLQSALLAADFFHLFVCLELMALSSYTLIAYKKDGKALFASFNYLAVSTAAIILYLFGLYLIYETSGTLS
ncbi:MAG TPA: proton-conducting transporter membrane subunit, partial [Magnetospirillaceae bacterium]|nr:proton-conducting transporter membrane subunit [Magnetospirillaceae bacterium]